MTPPDPHPPAGPLTRRQLRELQAADAASSLTADNDATASSEAPLPAEAPGLPEEAPSAEEIVRQWAEEASAPMIPATQGIPSAQGTATPEAPLQWAGEEHPPTALAWVSPERLTAASDDSELDGYAPSLLSGVPPRAGVHPAVAVPVLALLGLIVAYALTMIVWPLHEVAPTVESAQIAPVASADAEMTWSPVGSGAVGVGGIGLTGSAGDAVPLASLTKVVSALMVLDRLPLTPGETGPSYSFTRQDSTDYWAYRSRNESALDVPVGGELTEYQLLQGTLMGSANNYITRLSREIWGSNQAFAAAAEDWLAARELGGITLLEPTGIDARNTADPASLIRLAEIAMANPVIREIVGTPVADIPGAGEVVNTNPLLGTPGVTGVKTGSLTQQRSGLGVPYWNLLAAKDITLGDTTVQLSVVVLGQPDDDARVAAAESLFAQVETQLNAPGPSVAAGTLAGTVHTVWGETVDIVTDEATRVITWNGVGATNRIALDLGESREAGETVGTVTSVGPVDTSVTTVSLAESIEGPSIWWRLTHPIELLGLGKR